MTNSLDLLEIGLVKGEVKYTQKCVKKFSAILNSILEGKKKTPIGDALIHLLATPHELTKEEYELLCDESENWDTKQAVQDILTKRVLYTNTNAKTELPEIDQYYKDIKDKLYIVSKGEGFDKGKVIANQPSKVLTLLKNEGISGTTDSYSKGEITSIPFGVLHKASANIKKINGEDITIENTHHFGHIVFIKTDGTLFKLSDSPYSIVIGYEEKISTSGKHICIIKTLDEKSHFFYEDGNEFTTFGEDKHPIVDFKGKDDKAQKTYFTDGVADIVSIQVGDKVRESMLFDKNGKMPKITLNNEEFFITGNIKAIDNFNNGWERDQRSKAMNIKKLATLTNHNGQENTYALDKDDNFMPLTTPTGEERYVLGCINTYPEDKTCKQWNNKVRYEGYGVNKQGESKKIRFNKDREQLTSGNLVEDIVQFDTESEDNSIKLKTKDDKIERLYSSVVRDEKGGVRKVWLGGDNLYKTATKNPVEEVINHIKDYPITVNGGFGSSYTRNVSRPKALVTNDSVLKIITRRENGTERTAYRHMNENDNKLGSLCYPGSKEDGYLVEIGESTKHIQLGSIQNITLELEDGTQQKRFLVENGTFLPKEIVSLGLIFNHIQLGRVQEITIKKDEKDILQYMNEKGEIIDNTYIKEKIDFQHVSKTYRLFGKEIRFICIKGDNKGYAFIGEDNNPIYFGDNKTEKLVSYDINSFAHDPITIYDTNENNNQHGLAKGLLSVRLQKTKNSNDRGVIMNISNEILHCPIQGNNKEIERLGNYCFTTPTEDKILTAYVNGVKEEILIERNGDIIKPQTFGFNVDYIHNGKSREDSKRSEDGTVTWVLKASKDGNEVNVKLTWKPRGKLGDGKLLYNQNPVVNISKGKLQKA